MPPQLREIGFHVQNHATQWHGFQHEIQFQEVGVAWIQLTQQKNRVESIPKREAGVLGYLHRPSSIVTIPKACMTSAHN